MIRSNQTSPQEFRRLLREITFLCAYEATSTLTTKTIKLDTPVASGATGAKLQEKVALIPIMRAGLGMVDAMLELLPNSDVFHIGMFRNEASLLPVQYFNKLPKKW